MKIPHTHIGAPAREGGFTLVLVNTLCWICGFITILTSVLMKPLSLLVAFSDVLSKASESRLVLWISLCLARLISHRKIWRVLVIGSHLAPLIVLLSIGKIAEARKTNVVIDPNETVCLDGYAIQVPRGYPGEGRYLPCEKYDEFMQTKNVKLLIGPAKIVRSSKEKISL